MPRVVLTRPRCEVVPTSRGALPDRRAPAKGEDQGDTPVRTHLGMRNLGTARFKGTAARLVWLAAGRCKRTLASTSALTFR
jgi:hypothetical protein